MKIKAYQMIIKIKIMINWQILLIKRIKFKKNWQMNRFNRAKKMMISPN